MAAKRQLFSVGDLCVDILQEIASKPLFGEEHKLRELDFSVGGNAANVAVISSKLGLKPVLISAIGKDFATSFLKKGLSNAGVQAKLIKSREENAFSVITVNKRGERAIQSVKNSLKELTASRVEKRLLPSLKAGDIVFFGGFYHLKNLRPGFKALLEKIKKRNAIVCFDTCFDTHGKWSIGSFLPFVDYLFVNDIELKHVARGRAMKTRAESLLKKGSKVVAVKRAGKGATLFAKSLSSETFPSVATRVVDSTAAGDAFNSGFMFGLLQGWSLSNCMQAGNFVAAKKIAQHGLAAPKPKEVFSFIDKNNVPELVFAGSKKKMSGFVAREVISLLERNPSASLALPTGETPKELYRLLAKACKKKKVSFSKAKFFALDEYAGLSQKDGNRFAFFLQTHFFGKVGAQKRNIFLLNGAAKSLGRECKRHEAAIKRHGIGLCILGIGRNGHVAFNEPGSSSTSLTRVVKLKKETRKVNGESFSDGLAPEKALTVGLKTIRANSKKILVLASGKHKAEAIAGTLKQGKAKKWPAASLKSHKNLVFVVDKAAAKRL